MAWHPEKPPFPPCIRKKYFLNRDTVLELCPGDAVKLFLCLADLCPLHPEVTQQESQGAEVSLHRLFIGHRGKMK